jgi:hypothetical protein
VKNGVRKASQSIKPTQFVIFARDANVAVILRRGPSAWFHVIRWDTDDDTFLHGAWFKGRIYPEKCDLAPDGGLLLCFMHQGSRLRTDYTDSWSAISRCPWLDALWLLPQGTIYGGGGRFTGNQSVMLRRFPGFPTEPHPKHPGHNLTIDFETTLELVPEHASNEEIEGADWSGRDQRDRLVYTTGGRLFLRDESASEDKCLADFSVCVPDPSPAPKVASAPLLPQKRTRENRRRKQVAAVSSGPHRSLEP